MPAGLEMLQDSCHASEARPVELVLHNLLMNSRELAELLCHEMAVGSWLNAYLLAAGLNQIVEDYIHPDPYSLNRAAKHLRKLRRPLGGIASSVARWAGAMIWQVHVLFHRRNILRLLQSQERLAGLVQQLADIVSGDTRSGTDAPKELLRQADDVLNLISGLPEGLLNDVLRLPSSFRTFDQDPEDILRTCERFSEKYPDRERPLLVIGVRTSGSYLAPLYSAYLSRLGWRSVNTLTLRPNQYWLGPERKTICGIVRSGGLVLLTDDPPNSGGSLGKVAASLEKAGIPAESIVLVLQLFESTSDLPPVLQRYASVLLPWEEWAIHQKLTPDAVAAALGTMLEPGARIGSVERLPLPDTSSHRSHVRALYQVLFIDNGSGREEERRVYVKGVGLGFFGQHSLAVTQPLAERLPVLYGVKEGLLYRTWLPEQYRFPAGGRMDENWIAGEIAEYVAARSRALPVEEDVSLKLGGRYPVWQYAGDILSGIFGPAAPVTRPALQRVAKRLLRVSQPSVVDGSMALSRWFFNEGRDRRLVKVNWDQRAFSNWNLACYDPVYDLAGAASSCEGTSLAQRLRSAYEQIKGSKIDAERWLIYQLLHLEERIRYDWHPDLRRAVCRLQQQYYAETFFQDLPSNSHGKLCAIDIDGVLESRCLGGVSLTPSSAMALRALVQHDYRPLLVTGRSLDEVRERCAAYGLIGGVAEYGAGIYLRSEDQSRGLLSQEDVDNLKRLRSALRGMEGVQLDSDYKLAVRAFRVKSNGAVRGLSAETIDRALDAAGVRESIRTIHGWNQTDFMVTGIDKGTGVRALLEEIGVDLKSAEAKPLCFAVGDSFSDLAMFELAELAVAPANADDAVVQAKIKRVRRSYQAGFSQAVALLIGHTPGSCSGCCSPDLSDEAKLLLKVLSAKDTGKLGKLVLALNLGLR